MSPVDDAVVDDVGVEVRQVQVADGLDEQQDEDDDDPAARTAGGRSEAARSWLRVRGAGCDADRDGRGWPADSRSTVSSARARAIARSPTRKALQLVVRRGRASVIASIARRWASRSVKTASPSAVGWTRTTRRSSAAWRRSTRPRCSIRSTMPVALATETSSESASRPIDIGPSSSRIVRTWRWTMLSEPWSQRRNMPMRSRGFQALSSSTIAWSMASRRSISQCHIDNLCHP